MKIDTIFFNATDGIKLNGFNYKSENAGKKIIISIHGMATNCMKKREETIAQKVNKIGWDYLAFNNRGHDLVNYCYRENGEKIIAGTAFEEISDSYFDILGAINWATENKYEEIYLLGHSLGCTKIVYTYHKFVEEKNTNTLESIKGIILLSMVDIPMALQIYLKENFAPMLTYAKNMEREHLETLLMPEEAFIHPISIKTFLRYSRDNNDIDFAKYSDETYEFKELNEIKVPLFMRWGNNRELIIQDAKDLCQMLQSKIQNKSKSISYIEGADHSYTGKEEEVADEIVSFLGTFNNYCFN